MGEIRIASAAWRRQALAPTCHVKPLRPGEDVMPLPLFRCCAAVGDLLRAGHDRTRDRVESLLAQRLQRMRSNDTTGGDRVTVRTPAGALRLTLLNDHDFSIRLTIAERVWLTAGELVASGQVLSDTAMRAAPGMRIDAFVGLPAGHPLAGMEIERVRILSGGTRFRIGGDLDHEVRLREIRDDPEELMAITRNEMLALAA